MSKINIPSSLEAARTSLAEIGGLINAKKWERAAIVAAYVTIDNRPGPRSRNIPRSLTPVQFAEFGITGLSSNKTVQRYVETWLAHRPRPQAGQEVDLDGLPEWPAAGPTGGRPRDTKAEDAATIIERRGASEVVQKMTKRQRNEMATELRRQQAADAAAAADRIAQDELANGVSNVEGARLRDYTEACNKLVEPVWQARHHLGFVIGDWAEYRGRLGQTDLESIRSAMVTIRDHLGVLDMHLTDDVVAEVLRHEQG